MKETRCVVKFFVLLLFAAALASPVWLSATTTGDDKDAVSNKDAASNKATASNSAEAATPAANPHAGHAMDMAAPQSPSNVGRQRKGMSMHVQHWMTLPTGSTNPTVTPLDPNTVPKFVNQLTRPATFVTNQTKFDPQLGRNVPLYDVTEVETTQQILPPGFPRTKIYAYSGTANVAGPGQTPNIQNVASTPGPTFEATANQRIFVHYNNEIEHPHMFPVDPTIHAANPNNAAIPQPPFVDANGNLLVPFPPGYPQFQSPVVTVPHLHGGYTPSASDGFPESWFADFSEHPGVVGPTFTGTTFEYFNSQLPTLLWYHDHALGMTRLNLAAGLEGMFIIRDPQHDNISPLLPSGNFEWPLMLTDRAFNSDGSIHFTTVGDNPDFHPYWDPEYFGDEIMVNGKVWPNLNVQRRQYRFRIVDGSNARFYGLSLVNQTTGQKIPFIQIGSDGGFLRAPVTMTHKLIAICERIDILVDFSNLPAGTKVVMTNDAIAPNPGGDPADANTGVVMQFTVQNSFAVHPKPLPATLITIPTLVATPNIGNPKLFTLNEQESPDTALFPGNPLHVLIDGRAFHEAVTEIPRAGTTEEWYIQNLTQDAHPIHIHLVEFQLEDRQAIDANRMLAYFEKLNGPNSALPLNHPPIRINVENPVQFCDPANPNNPDGTPTDPSDPTCVLGARDFQFDTQNGALGTTDDFTEPGVPSTAIPASQFPGEDGWKDVVLAPPFVVTRVLVRLALQNTNDANLQPGQNVFPFDPTAGPGYVWHCHILDHEDNDMMRPMVITFKNLPSLNSATHIEPGTLPGTQSTPAVASQPAQHDHSTPAASKPVTPAAEQPSRGTMPLEQQQPQQQQQQQRMK
ncbi:MAG TPA: multicopper oxidase domain-containing protein [Candidatus Angelobacter sp.]|nr:multicopper oxidase domain-containing protein [Candidatus Angelobacter sp.]